MMHPYSYSYNVYYGGQMFAIIAVIVAVILAVVLYFTFLNKKNEGKYRGAAAKIYDFLSFNKFYAEDILKLLYIVSASVITVAGIIALFFGKLLQGLLVIILGNIALRVCYELIMMFIILCRKTVSIDKRLNSFEAADREEASFRQEGETAEENEISEEEKALEERINASDR